MEEDEYCDEKVIRFIIQMLIMLLLMIEVIKVTLMIMMKYHDAYDSKDGDRDHDLNNNAYVIESRYVIKVI